MIHMHLDLPQSTTHRLPRRRLRPHRLRRLVPLPRRAHPEARARQAPLRRRAATRVGRSESARRCRKLRSLAESRFGNLIGPEVLRPRRGQEASRGRGRWTITTMRTRCALQVAMVRTPAGEQGERQRWTMRQRGRPMASMPCSTCSGMPLTMRFETHTGLWLVNTSFLFQLCKRAPALTSRC